MLGRLALGGRVGEGESYADGRCGTAPTSVVAAPSTAVPTPPPPRRRHRTAPAATHADPPPAHLEHYTRLLNPTDPTHGPIFADGDDACFYETPTPVPPGELPPMGWRGRDRHPIDCPPEMDDAVWDQCAPGELTQNPSTGHCVCSIVEFVEGPDTPRYRIACPTQ